MARLVVSADFERVLGSASRATTLHFAVHHLPARRGASAAALQEPSAAKLSTIGSQDGARAVDDFPDAASSRRLGAIVPKRHARRAVTRSLLKRLIYSAGQRHAASLALGLWIVRLRRPFDRDTFPSASSPALRTVARNELDSLFRAAGRASPS
jgi:ribonuclease P protein component